MERPAAEVEGCRHAHERLCAAVGEITDPIARRGSLLPEWTVGHVMTHLARNAEAMVRRIEGATRGELIDQYAGGAAGRASDIEAGAGRSAQDLVADVRTWSGRLDDTFASLPDDCWGQPVRSLGGSVHPVGQLPFRRWREVEIHLVDLDIGFGPTDWSQALVERALPRLIEGLAARADQRALMAWTLGRGSPPMLEPWG